MSDFPAVLNSDGCRTWRSASHGSRNGSIGDVHPTLKQLESYARATHTPVGYLFLQTPPVDRVPIPDLRTVGLARGARPSPDLLDTIYICQQRQEWYREFARSTRVGPLPFVGSAQLTSDIRSTAVSIRETLGFDLDE